MKLVKFTKARPPHKGEDVYVAPAHVAAVLRGGLQSTAILLCDRTKYEVTETVDEVVRLLKEDGA